MSSSIEFDQSLKDVLAGLDSLPIKIQTNLVRGALRAAAKPILEAAREAVPVKSGALRASIRVTTGVDRRTGTIKASIKAGGKSKLGNAYYAHMVEFGTKRHLIKGPVMIGGRLFLNINHPGAQQSPFMRPAFDSAGQASVDAYGAYITKRMPDLLSKFAVVDDGD